MTKQQELSILDTAIKSLGPDSYLGPWLQQVRGSVEQAIRSDYIPDITLEHARLQVEQFKQQGAEIVESANRKASAILSDCDKELRRRRLHIESLEGNLRRAINEAENALNR